MKIFAFLFRENYSIYDLFSGDIDLVYFGESSIFSVSTGDDSLILGIALQTELEGSWQTSCYTSSNDNSYIDTVTIEGNILTIKYEIHSDIDCTNDYAIIEESHKISAVGDAVNFSNGETGREFTVVIGSTQIYTPQSDTAVNNYNSGSECSFNDWQLNSEKECSNDNEDIIFYCLYQLDGNYLYPICDSSSKPSESSLNIEDESNTFVKQ